MPMVTMRYSRGLTTASNHRNNRKQQKKLQAEIHSPASHIEHQKYSALKVDPENRALF